MTDSRATPPGERVDGVTGELRQTVAEIMAGEEVRGLQRRLVLGEIHGNPVAEVTAKRRPDSGIISGLLIVTASVVVAFIVGFASIAINEAKTSQGTSTTSTTTSTVAP
jgi:hypothetical protein